jgi:hypothetical protein
MGYIIKNTSGLLNTRITDMGRKKLSEGRFNISYFQVGDSEILYNLIPNYNQADNYVLEPAYNAQNGDQQPQTNKANIKYPIKVQGPVVVVASDNTYGIPFRDSQVSPVFNTAAPKGFFSGSPSGYTAYTSSAYTITSNYMVEMCSLCGTDIMTIIPDFCSPTTGTPSVNDFVTIFFDASGSCGNIVGDFPILTYKVQGVTGTTIQVDRNLPYFSGISCCGNARAIFYPSGMTVLYDTATPQGYWPPNVLDFETICEISEIDVPVWNMNIPWSVNPAGLLSTVSEGFQKFGSREYLGTKEYLGYQSISGQSFYVTPIFTSETTNTYFYNSFDEPIFVQPYEQKTIAIVHFTNNAIDTFYGEKFATEPFDIGALDPTGFARNFKVTIPWLMWHKTKTGIMGETFYIDPQVGSENYLDIKYMKSSRNEDMNEPGLRYYHLWDTHLNDDSNPSRVGKVFPDLKIIVFDDEEIVAAMSYKANRNWTLPAPKLFLVTPNTCDTTDDDFGLLGNNDEYLYVTYRFNTTSGLTNSLHCNYYVKIQGPSEDCTTSRQDVSVKFGDEFFFLKDCCPQGYSANEFMILAQVVTGSTTQPDPENWRIIDYTNQLSGSSINGYIQASGMTASTFTISYNQYNNAGIYNLADYLTLPVPFGEEFKLNFGDEYYFYGNIQTDIQATIYEMKYLCNLQQTQFLTSTNPTWTLNDDIYITEIGLFDSDKDLMVITKLQQPVKRQGTQQFAIKLDF